jgi:hypothetical protein
MHGSIFLPVLPSHDGYILPEEPGSPPRPTRGGSDERSRAKAQSPPRRREDRSPSGIIVRSRVERIRGADRADRCDPVRSRSHALCASLCELCAFARAAFRAIGPARVREASSSTKSLCYGLDFPAVFVLDDVEHVVSRIRESRVSSARPRVGRSRPYEFEESEIVEVVP